MFNQQQQQQQQQQQHITTYLPPTLTEGPTHETNPGIKIDKMHTVGPTMHTTPASSIKTPSVGPTVKTFI